MEEPLQHLQEIIAALEMAKVTIEGLLQAIRELRGDNADLREQIRWFTHEQREAGGAGT